MKTVSFFQSAFFFCLLTILFTAGIATVAFWHGEEGAGMFMSIIAGIFLMLLPACSTKN